MRTLVYLYIIDNDYHCQPIRTIKMPHPANVLIDDLLQEPPGILNFALSGLRRLKDNGYVFTPSKAVDEILGSYQRKKLIRSKRS